jgi:hypothetical protein
MLNLLVSHVVSNNKPTTTARAVGIAHQWWYDFRFSQHGCCAHLDLNDTFHRLGSCNLLRDATAATNTAARAISIATRWELLAPLQDEAMAALQAVESRVSQWHAHHLDWARADSDL